MFVENGVLGEAFAGEQVLGGQLMSYGSMCAGQRAFSRAGFEKKKECAFEVLGFFRVFHLEEGREREREGERCKPRRLVPVLRVTKPSSQNGII